MKYFAKKMWFSFLASLLILLTAITTTYAYYAMGHANDVDEFELGIGGSKSIQISVDGNNFYSDIDSDTLKASILKKRGIDISGLSKSEINALFDLTKLDPATPKDYNNLSLGFESLEGNQITKEGYLAFDLYFAADTSLTYDESGNQIGQPVYFTADSQINSRAKTYDLNGFGLKAHDTLGTLDKKIKIKASNSARLGASIYEVSNIGQEPTKINREIIYAIGSNTPYTDSNNVYNFGGINASYNVALSFYNNVQGTHLTVPENDREDTVLDRNEFLSKYDLLSSGKMVKVEFYVWLEGWDADCFDAVKGEVLNIALAFASYSSS